MNLYNLTAGKIACEFLGEKQSQNQLFISGATIDTTGFLYIESTILTKHSANNKSMNNYTILSLVTCFSKGNYYNIHWLILSVQLSTERFINHRFSCGLCITNRLVRHKILTGAWARKGTVWCSASRSELWNLAIWNMERKTKKKKNPQIWKYNWCESPHHQLCFLREAL